MSRMEKKSTDPDLMEPIILDESIRSIILNIPGIALLLDENGVILMASRTASKEIAHSDNSLIGMNFKSFVSDIDQTKIDGLMVSDNTEYSHPIDIHLSWGNTNPEIYSLNISVFNINQHKVFILTLTSSHEDDNKKIEKLEHQAAIGTFTSGIAHEFNNILAGIRGYTQLAKNDLNDVALVKKAFNVIENETSRGAQLCRNLSLYSGSKPLNLEPVDLANAIKQTIDSQEKYLSDYNITIKTEFDDIPLMMADKQRIYQLLANLLTNARHAIIPKGTGNISVSLVNDHDFIKIIIIDDGIGLSKNQIDHIFEPFYMNRSASNTGNNKNSEIRGTGLGLPVCEVIAKQHGGSITVRSGIDDGTIFTVTLPKKFAQVFSGISGTIWKKNSKINPVKVLVVDDEMAIREIIYRALCNLDTETFLAANMKELQDLIMDHVFDLIFLDYMLPEMTADKILPVLRDKFPAARIVMISGWNGSPRKKAQLEKTVDAWIDKPFNVDLLVEQLEIFRKSII